MRPSVLRPPRALTLATRRLGAGVVLAAVAVTGLAPAAAADDQASLTALRAERAVLIGRIADATDAAVGAQARAVANGKRRFLANLAFDDARRHVARYEVDAYVDGLGTSQVRQLRRGVYTEVVSKTDRYLYAVLEHTRSVADAETIATERAADDARRATDELRRLRDQLEQTIAAREAADLATAVPRSLATSSLELSAHPTFARATRSEGSLLGQFPFGPVGAVPAGLVATGQVVAGPASWYGPGFDGRPTASGAIFDQEGFTVASKELPLGTILLIHYGDRAVLALVNDRGPYVAGRVLDLSHGVASALGTTSAGVAGVVADVLVPG